LFFRKIGMLTITLTVKFQAMITTSKVTALDFASATLYGDRHSLGHLTIGVAVNSDRLLPNGHGYDVTRLELVCPTNWVPVIRVDAHLADSIFWLVGCVASSIIRPLLPVSVTIFSLLVSLKSTNLSA